MYKHKLDDNPVMHLTSYVCVTQVLSLQSFTFLAKYHIGLCSFNELFPTTFKYTHLFHHTFTITPFVFGLVTEFQKCNPLSLWVLSFSQWCTSRMWPSDAASHPRTRESPTFTLSNSLWGSGYNVHYIQEQSLQFLTHKWDTQNYIYKTLYYNLVTNYNWEMTQV